MSDQTKNAGAASGAAQGAQDGREAQHEGQGSGRAPGGTEGRPASVDEWSRSFAQRSAEQITGGGSRPPAPRSREEALQARLQEATGLPAHVAKIVAEQGGHGNVQRMLARFADERSHGDVDLGGALAGERTGDGLTGALEGAGRGGKTQADDDRLARAEAALQRLQADALAPRLSETRHELLEMYPELQDQAAWDAATDRAIKALGSGFAEDPVEALRGAVMFQYGARVPGHSVPNASTAYPTPGRAGHPTPGERALDAKGAKSRIAQMIFDGRPAEEVDAARRRYERDLGIQLGSRQ